MASTVWSLVTALGPVVVEKVMEYLASKGKEGKSAALNQSEKKAVRGMLAEATKGKNMDVEKVISDFAKVAATPGLIEGSMAALSEFWTWASGKQPSECQAQLLELQKRLMECEERCAKTPAAKAKAKAPAAKAKAKAPAAKAKAKSPWIAHVKAYYARRKADDPTYKYSQAMKEASETYRAGTV